MTHDDVIKWKHFPRNWPFVRGIHRSPVNSPHKGQWRGALMFSLICAWINDWVNNGEADGLRSHLAHYDVNVMIMPKESDHYDEMLLLAFLVLNPEYSAITRSIPWLLMPWLLASRDISNILTIQDKRTCTSYAGFELPAPSLWWENDKLIMQIYFLLSLKWIQHDRH